MDEKIDKIEEKVQETTVPTPEKVPEKTPEKTVDKELEKNIKEGAFSIDDIFITENNTFDVSVSFYKEKNSLIVESIDDAFSAEKPCTKIGITFKYPSQGDVSRINTISSQTSKNVESMDIREYTMLEVSRMLCLIRKWDINKPINNENIMNLSPKIVKAIINKLREAIGTEGIF